jgi:hypothetical protein
MKEREREREARLYLHIRVQVYLIARHKGVLLCKTDFEVGLNKTLTKFYAFQGDILVVNFADCSL